MPCSRVCSLKIGNQVHCFVIVFNTSFQVREFFLQQIAEGIEVAEIGLEMDRNVYSEPCLVAVTRKVASRHLYVIPGIGRIKADKDLVFHFGAGRTEPHPQSCGSP